MSRNVLNLNNADTSTPDDENVHRPDCRVWIDDEGPTPFVVLTVDALHGQQLRFVEMTSHEAGQLAHMLQSVAADVMVLEEMKANAEINRAERKATARDARGEDVVCDESPTSTGATA